LQAPATLHDETTATLHDCSIPTGAISAPGTERPRIDVAVVLERTAKPNAWQDWSFRVLEVVPQESAFGSQVRLVFDDGRISRWLFPGFSLELFADECKGYFLNLTSGNPCWFVSYRPVDGDDSMMEVTAASVSYIEADRRLFAGEQVESVPLAPELCQWLQAYTNQHFVPEEKRKVRAMSFLSPEERERHERLARAQWDTGSEP
jgi:Protein of unknown function (DUF3305)